MITSKSPIATGLVMKGTIDNLYSKIAILFMAILLQSCGGSSTDNTIYSISADVNNATFSNEYLHESNESIAIKVNFDGEGLLVGFAPESEDMRWLTYRSDNVTATSATIYLDVINGERLPAASYDTKIRLTTSNIDGSKFAYHDIDVSLLVWNISIDTDQVNFSATFGDATTPVQTIDITSDNEWTATTDESWLSLDVTSGTGNATISVSAATTHASVPELSRGNITFTEVTSGDSKSIPVELALDNIYLYADSSAIALTKTANINAIEQVINVNSNAEVAVTWQATTTADWLTLTPLNDSQLQITANSDLAPSNQISSAEITISANNEMLVIDETVKIDFYHSDLNVENKIIEPLAIDSAMLVSPSLPNFYLAKGNELHRYHQYTAVLEKALVISPEGTELEQLIMHPKGDYILAKAIETLTNEDESITEITHRYRISLIDDSIEELTDSTISYEPMAIMRFSGRYFVLTETLEFADEALELQYWDAENAYFANAVDMAITVNNLFALDNSEVAFKRYTAQINDFGENSILPSLTHTYHPESLAEGQLINDFIVSNDEGNIYAISETSEWISFDGTTFTDNGLLEKDENVVSLLLAKSQNKQNSSSPNYFRIDTTKPDGFYLATYDEQQNESRTVYTQGNQPSSIAISGDNQRLMINTNTPSTSEVDARIELVTLEP